MQGPMEVVMVRFVTGRWRAIEAHLKLDGESHDVSMTLLFTRRHWFRKLLGYELRGSMRNIGRFIQMKLDDGSCIKIGMPNDLSKQVHGWE